MLSHLSFCNWRIASLLFFRLIIIHMLWVLVGLHLRFFLISLMSRRVTVDQNFMEASFC